MHIAGRRRNGIRNAIGTQGQMIWHRPRRLGVGASGPGQLPSHVEPYLCLAAVTVGLARCSMRLLARCIQGEMGRITLHAKVVPRVLEPVRPPGDSDVSNSCQLEMVQICPPGPLSDGDCGLAVSWQRRKHTFFSCGPHHKLPVPWISGSVQPQLDRTVDHDSRRS